jgi:hypothetical protein
MQFQPINNDLACHLRCFTSLKAMQSFVDVCILDSVNCIRVVEIIETSVKCIVYFHCNVN